MRRLLIIDADLSVTQPLAYLLEQNGFEVAVTSSLPAPDAEMLTDVDVVLLDLELPDADLHGVALCSELRSGSSVPIIVLTALDSEDMKVRALEAGADDYVTKPFSSRELIARVAAVIRRYDGHEDDPNTSVLLAGPLRMDLARHVVTMHEAELALRLKEFTVLELLVRSRSQVVTRGRLIERIWGQRFDGDPKRVDAIIKRLREKLEVDPANPQHVLTIRGLGYRFDA